MEEVLVKGSSDWIIKGVTEAGCLFLWAAQEKSLHVLGDGRKWNSNKTEELSFLVAYIHGEPIILDKSAKPSALYAETSSRPDLKSTQQDRKGEMLGNGCIGLC